MLGFYPVDPLSQTYQIGSPVFSTAILHLNQDYYPGVEFAIRATNNSARNRYIRSATLNGVRPDHAAPLAQRDLGRWHADLEHGQHRFELGQVMHSSFNKVVVQGCSVACP